MSYLVCSDGKTPIAQTQKDYGNVRSTHGVEYAYDTSHDDLAQCEQLVNARPARISNAKKWDKYITLPVAREIDNERRFLFKVESTDEPYYQ